MANPMTSAAGLYVLADFTIKQEASRLYNLKVKKLELLSKR